eukprot:3231819-Pleurochrysis_carterae.AAC.5
MDLPQMQHRARSNGSIQGRQEAGAAAQVASGEPAGAPLAPSSLAPRSPGRRRACRGPSARPPTRSRASHSSAVPDATTCTDPRAARGGRRCGAPWSDLSAEREEASVQRGCHEVAGEAGSIDKGTRASALAHGAHDRAHAHACAVTLACTAARSRRARSRCPRTFATRSRRTRLRNRERVHAREAMLACADTARRDAGSSRGA